MSLLSSLPAGRADVPPYRLLCARSRPSSLRLVALDITTSTYDTLSVRGHRSVTAHRDRARPPGGAERAVDGDGRGAGAGVRQDRSRPVGAGGGALGRR